jgi:hypothetical protein
MRTLFNGRIACVALGVVVAGLGMASVAGAGAQQGPAMTRVPASSAASTPAPAPSLPIGSIVIYSNLGAGGSYQCCIGFTIGGSASPVGFNRAAMPFTPSSNSQLVQIDVALGHVVGTNAATVQLANDNAGFPGAVIRTWTVAFQPSFGATTTTLTTAGGALIPVAAGHKYWVIIQALSGSNTWDAWNLNSTSANATYSFDAGAGWQHGSGLLGAFDVLGCTKLCKVA